MPDQSRIRSHLNPPVVSNRAIWDFSDAVERLGSLVATGGGAMRADLTSITDPADEFMKRLLPVGLKLDRALDIFVTADEGAWTEQRRNEAVQVLKIGALSLIKESGNRSDINSRKRWVEAILRSAFGARPEDDVLRQALLGRPAHTARAVPRGRTLSGPKLKDSRCVDKFRASLTALVDRDTPMPRVFEDGIAGLDPRDACPGTTMTINGGPFGNAKPTAIGVIFSSSHGGYTAAEATAWSDTSVSVTVPDSAVEGPIGFVEAPVELGPLFEDRIDELSALILSCLGNQVKSPADFLHQAVRSSLSNGPKVTRGNVYRGGPPVIKSFRVNDETSARIGPGGDVVLSWYVEKATKIQLTATNVSGQHTITRLPRALPADGAHLLRNLQGDQPWTAKIELSAWNKCTPENRPVTRRIILDMARKVGVVLSGGGAKGSFQLGALRYMYDRGIRPEVVVGTSVGAINAIKLAEGDEIGGQNAQEKLETIWWSLNGSSSMYLERPWVRRLKTVEGKQWVKRIVDAPATNLGKANLLFEAASQHALHSMAMPGWALYDQLSIVADVVGFLSDIQTAMKSGSIYTLGPIETLLKDPVHLDLNKVKASSISLRLAMVGLRSGTLRYMDNQGDIYELLEPDHDNPRASFDKGFLVESAGDGWRDALVKGVLGSAAIPGVFEAQEIRGDSYVDGGVREVSPIRQAVAEGANVIYSLAASPRRAQVLTTAPTTLFEIAQRSVMDLLVNEIAQGDVYPTTGWGPGIAITVIDPDPLEDYFTVHGTTEIIPRLLRISYDYGYMRAVDELEIRPRLSADEYHQCREIARQIIEKRRRNFDDDRVADTWRVQTDPEARDSLLACRKRRWEIYELAKARHRIAGSGSMPGRPADWWLHWESEKDIWDNPWVAIPSVNGANIMVNAAAPPPTDL